jgi:hypothetical protein
MISKDSDKPLNKLLIAARVRDEHFFGQPCSVFSSHAIYRASYAVDAVNVSTTRRPTSVAERPPTFSTGTNFVHGKSVEPWTTVSERSKETSVRRFKGDQLD